MKYTNVDLLRRSPSLDPTPGLADLIADRIADRLTKEGVTPVESDLVDAKDAARIMGITLTAFVQMRKRGRLPPGCVVAFKSSGKKNERVHYKYVRSKLVQPTTHY